MFIVISMKYNGVEKNTQATTIFFFIIYVNPSSCYLPSALIVMVNIKKRSYYQYHISMYENSLDTNDCHYFDSYWNYNWILSVF
jgi:hypothetical protein